MNKIPIKTTKELIKLIELTELKNNAKTEQERQNAVLMLNSFYGTTNTQ